MASMAPGIARELKCLRRYATTLFGSPDEGESLIRTCIEAIVAAPEQLDRRRDLRLQLFALFHALVPTAGETGRAFRSRTTGFKNKRPACLLGSAHASDALPIGNDLDHENDMAEGAAFDLTMSTPSRERQVLLLVALEHFTIEETSYILGVSDEEVQIRLELAREAIYEQIKHGIRIEQDPIVAMSIAEMVCQAREIGRSERLQ